MYKIFFSIGFLIFMVHCFAQVPSSDTVRIIEIINGLSLREKTIDSVTSIQTIAGNVLLREGATKFSCDSAIINRKLNTLEAFGNVHINDADSLHTYAQYIKYIGTERIAYLKKNVRLTDKKGTLLTQDLVYDLKAGIGKYHNGGKVINGTTTLTSSEGTYYADTKDVLFKNNVDLTDPKYKIKADSLLYNTNTQGVTFTGPTYIKSKEADIFTTEGTYDLKNGNAFFGSRTLIKDTSGRIYQANHIAMEDKSGQAQLEGNAIIKDSVNGVIVTANLIFINRNNSFLATMKPVMIIQQEKDSIYISADTLFSGFTTKISAKNITANKDSVKKGVLKKSDSLNVVTPVSDSLKVATSMSDSPMTDSVKITSLKSDTSRKTNIIPVNNVVTSMSDSLKTDSVKITSLKSDTSRKTKIIPVNKVATPMSDSLKADSVKITSLKSDTSLKTKIIPVNVATSGSDSLKADSVIITSLKSDTSRKTSIISINKNDSSIRYFLAFHHVRIFNDSLQSVCDSLFYSTEDSTFRLFQDPVVWSGESQVTGDTIYLFTKNKKVERFYVFENGMIINKSNNKFYNQIAGKTINGYFKKGVIDYVRVKGQKAESIYYAQDKDSAYVGMNRATGDVIDMYFIKNQLNKVKFVNDVHGIMHPMNQIPEDQKFLNNFKWQDKRRPKNKLELFE
jgi:lipopolysaccharide export system protein LptA